MNCENADTLYRFVDDDGNEQVLNLMDFEIAVTDDKGRLTGEFMSYGEYMKLTKQKK